jgi:hypothetical protein
MDKRVQSLPQPPSVAATAKPKVATKSGLLLGACQDDAGVGGSSFPDVTVSAIGRAI